MGSKNKVDCIVGGPPCQGYSGIGHRRTFTGIDKHDIPSNHLYREIAKFIAAVRPKAFLFENVKGLLSSRWYVDGEKGEIWEDVQAAFKGADGYESLPEFAGLADYHLTALIPGERPPQVRRQDGEGGHDSVTHAR